MKQIFYIGLLILTMLALYAFHCIWDDLSRQVELRGWPSVIEKAIDPDNYDHRKDMFK
jgi:hypothetical protein